MTDRPAIKPLEWEHMCDEDGDWLQAATPFHTWCIAFNPKHKLPWVMTPFGLGLDSNYATQETAKAAAQAHHEKSIRSCLIDKPEAGEGERLRAENAKLKKIIASCQWHWPADDTSSEMCSDGPWEIAENCDVRPGEVFAYSRGGVVETRWYGFLPAADDADSDDEFTVDEATEDTAAAKMNAEIARRAALTQEPTNE